jgi:putative transposase
MSGAIKARRLLKIATAVWPSVDLSGFDEDKRAGAENRALAIRLYEQGTPLDSIARTTGLSRQEVSRLFTRCQTVAPDGRIYGFRALLPGTRIKGYTRSAPVVHARGDGSGGCSGAFTNLLTRFHGLAKFILDEFIPATKKRKEQHAKISVANLHGKVITWLKDHGLKDNEWPLNTQNEGLESLRRYCNALIETHEARWVKGRAGANAAMRNKIGLGVTPVFTPARPFTAVQLDFHKIDAASIITITNTYGVDIDVPLPRWHIGLLFEERFELILAVVVALEKTPSSDSVLETIECALVPVVDEVTGCGFAIGMGGKIFPNQILKELKGQGFSILRMDNGWSNTAIDVIDNVMDVVGCAVNFGPVRAWWSRDGIERVFGQITRAALQCAPSTYGSGPGDPVRDRPEEAAVKLRIRLTDLMRALEKVVFKHNQDRTEALSMGGPMASLVAAMNKPNGFFLRTPIVDADQKIASDSTLVMYKTVPTIVRGNPKKGVRPYVKIGRWRYTNECIAKDYSLIGSPLKCYCSIRDARVVRAINLSTGEDFGRLMPPARWARTRISFRMRALTYSAGDPMRRKERRDIQAHEWLPPGPSVISGLRTAAKDIPTKDEALAAAKFELSTPTQKPAESPPAQTPPPEKLPPATSSNTGKGLFNLDVPIVIGQSQ